MITLTLQEREQLEKLYEQKYYPFKIVKWFEKHYNKTFINVVLKEMKKLNMCWTEFLDGCYTNTIDIDTQSTIIFNIMNKLFELSNF